MKRMSKVFLGIGALTMLASGALAIGLAANPKEAVKVNADDIVASGKITLDTSINWAEQATDCKIAVYFFDSTETKNGWSNLVDMPEGQCEVEVDYALTFSPAKMIAVRFDPIAESAGWSNVWNQAPNTGGYNIGSHIRITSQDTAVVDDYAAIIGMHSAGSWGEISFELDSIKKSGSSHCEYYHDRVEFAVGDEFKTLFAGSLLDSFTTGDGIASGDFTGGNGSNIVVNKAGFYSFYFDSKTHNLHIASATVADADRWAQYFLENNGCDPTGVALPTGWSNCATEYAKLADDVKDYIYAADATKTDTYTEQAVAQYDWAVAHHSELEKFIVNRGGTPRATISLDSVNPLSHSLGDTTKVVATVVIVSLVAVTTIGGIIILKRKER